MDPLILNLLNINYVHKLFIDVIKFNCSSTQPMLRAFENRELGRIFGPKRDEITGEWRKLHNKELNDPYSSPSIFRVIKSYKNEMGGACSTYGERSGVYRV